MLKVQSLLFLVCLGAGSIVHAEIQGPQLRDHFNQTYDAAVISQVIRDSKDPNSALRTVIAKYDVADGRNQNGTVNVPLSSKDLQVLLTSAENQFGSYCSADPSDKKYLICQTGQLATYTVAIASLTGVHKASEYAAILVEYTVDQTVTWKQDPETNQEVKGFRKTVQTISFGKDITP